MTLAQIVIYQSKWAAERDSFFFDNPEYIGYIVLGSIGILVIVILADWIRKQFGIGRRRW